MNLKRIIQFLIPALLIGTFFFLLGYFKSYHLPKIKTWVLIEIESYSRQHLPVQIWPRSLEIDLLPPKVTFKNIRIRPQKELSQQLAPFKIQSASASPNVFGLLTGNFEIANITLDDFEVTYIENQKPIEETKKEPKPKKEDTNEAIPLFKSIERVPVNEVIVSNFDFQFKTSQHPLGIKAKDAFLRVNKEKNRLSLETDIPEFLAKKLGEDPILNISLATRWLLQPNTLTLTALKIKKGQSYIVGNGAVSGDIEKFEWSEVVAKVRSSLKSEEIIALTVEFLPEETIPQVQGIISSEFDVNLKKDGQPKLNFQLDTDPLKIEGYEVGSIKGRGQLSKSELLIKNLRVRNSAGSANIENGKFELTGQNKFRANVFTKKLEVAKLLKSIKINEVPIYIPINADIPCFGAVKPRFKLKCKGVANIEHLNVWPDSSKENQIVEIDEGRVIGEFEVNDKEVNFETRLKIGESVGWSNGKVSYSKGFNINYGGNIRSFQNTIKDLVGLNIEGDLLVKGNTHGDSSYGRILMDLEAKDLWLDDWGLGSPSLELRYKKGILTFRKIKGIHNTTRFRGQVSINLINKLMSLDINSPFIDLADVQELLARKLELPFSITGTGSTKIKLSGPLEFSRMSYNLDGNFFRGTIYNETFDQLNLQIESTKGHIRAKKFDFKKAESTVQVKGKMDPKWDMDTIILGNALRIEQSENLTKLGLNAGGQLDFTVAMKGPITSPQTELHGRLSKMVIGNRNEKDSQFWLKFNKENIQGKGKFLGDIVRSEFNIPYTKDLPMEVYLKTDNWNFTQIFTMFSGALSQQSYEASLTTEIKLKSPKNWIWGANGSANINNLLLKRGNTFLQSVKPIEVSFNKGTINTKDFRLEGPSSFLNFESKNSTSKNIDFSINSKFDLGLLTLVTPFLDDLSGTSSFTLNLKGPWNNPDILGSAYIQDGFLRLKGLTHSFEKLTGDLLFSQKSIVVNTLKGEFAGGQLTADGKIIVKSSENIPINIKGQLRDAELNIPEGFKTKGNAEIFFKGKTLPYTLGGTYKISGGKVFADLLGGDKQTKKVQPSDFLPKFLSEKSFDPVKLDFDIQIKKPLDVEAIVPEAQIKTKVEGRVRVKESPSSPILKGLIKTVPGGQMLFRDNNFEILSANIEYKDYPPEHPDLFVSSRSLVKARPQSGENENETEEYEVTLEVQGNAKEPTITLSSQPQLVESDIISLLAFGITSSNYQQLDSDQQANQGGLELGAQIVKQKLGITDTFEKTTGVKLDVSSTMSDDGTAVPKLSFKKEFTPKFGASLSRTEGTSPRHSMKLEYKFNQRLSVIGQFEAQDTDATTDSDDESKTQEKIGLDLEYKFRFK